VLNKIQKSHLGGNWEEKHFLKGFIKLQDEIYLVYKSDENLFL